MRNLRPEERLIVAADFKPADLGLPNQKGASVKAVRLAEEFSETPDICIKMNSLLRVGGYEMFEVLRQYGINVFADYKLIDIGETMATDGAFLREVKPKFVTVMCCAGRDAIRRLKDELDPSTKLLGVTVLTSWSEDDAQRMFGCSVNEAVIRFGEEGRQGSVDGFVCSPKEVGFLRRNYGDWPFLVTPGVRFEDQRVQNDDQNPNRVMTPRRAIEAGADAVVMGRPIVDAPVPLIAVQRALRELTF